MVQCPGCRNTFKPVAMAQDTAVATAAPAMKECDYCGEQILATAKKCRHCGEILDVALRVA
jgi:uncharacterized protein (UPF0212 family)